MGHMTHVAAWTQLPLTDRYGACVNGLFPIPTRRFFSQKRHPYRGNLDTETPGDSKDTIPHWGDVSDNLWSRPWRMSSGGMCVMVPWAAVTFVSVWMRLIPKSATCKALVFSSLVLQIFAWQCTIKIMTTINVDNIQYNNILQYSIGANDSIQNDCAWANVKVESLRN